MTSDNATEEYKRISEFMRAYLLLRLYRLTMLLGTSGAIVTALADNRPVISSVPVASLVSPVVP
jgi:hypothetical protein